jgi:hypothetical protein
MTPNLNSFANELTKTSDIAKVVRILKTPIPGTPKLIMKKRSKDVLQAEEHALREKLRDKINENIYKGLKKLRVDKAYQKLEPVLGAKTAPKNIRETFGERQIHEMAHRPFHYLLGKAPIPYVSSAHNILSEAHQKLMGVPPPRAYKMPEGVVETVKKKMTGKEKAVLAAKLTGSAGVGAAGTAALMSHGENQ